MSDLLNQIPFREELQDLQEEFQDAQLNKTEYSKRLLEGGTLPNKVLREGESQNSIYAVRSMGIPLSRF